MTEFVYGYRFDQISPLQQVVFILKRLGGGESSSDELAFGLGLEENRIRMLLVSLRDMHWIKEKQELWTITEKGDMWLRNIENAIETG